MKNVFCSFLLLLTIEAMAQSRDEIAIRRVLDDQTKAWNTGDINGFMKGYWQNDSLVFIGKSGLTHGWNRTLDNYKKNYPDTIAMGKLIFTSLSVKNLSPEYFHVIGKWQLRRSIGNLEGYFTLLFKKINDNWVIIADHSS